MAKNFGRDSILTQKNRGKGNNVDNNYKYSAYFISETTTYSIEQDATIELE